MSTTATTAETRKFKLAPLPYAYNSLEPEISEETLRFHHDKHHAGYVAKLNTLIAGTPYEMMSLKSIVEKSDGAIFNNAAQVWNHDFYFDTLSPTPKSKPEGALLEAIVGEYGSLENMQKAMDEATVNLFGSGWVWLVANNDGRLSIMSGANADNPLQYGDVNLDGEASIADAMLIMQYKAKIIQWDNLDPTTEYKLRTGDVSGDGEVTVADAMLIMQFLAGMIPSFPIQG